MVNQVIHTPTTESEQLAYKKEKRRKVTSAKRRAVNRLIKAHPDEYIRYYQEEVR